MSVATPVRPATFEEFRKSMGPTGWMATLRLLRTKGKEVMVAESEAFMGKYSAVVLTGQGFQLESGRAALQAAFCGRTDPTHTPIKNIADVVERAIAFSGPLEDDPPNTPTPSEGEILASLLEKIEEIRNSK